MLVRPAPAPGPHAPPRRHTHKVERLRGCGSCGEGRASALFWLRSIAASKTNNNNGLIFGHNGYLSHLRPSSFFGLFLRAFAIWPFHAATLHQHHAGTAAHIYIIPTNYWCALFSTGDFIIVNGYARICRLSSTWSSIITQLTRHRAGGERSRTVGTSWRSWSRVFPDGCGLHSFEVFTIHKTEL